MAKLDDNEDIVNPTNKLTTKQIFDAAAAEATLASMATQKNKYVNTSKNLDYIASAGQYYGAAKTEADALRVETQKALTEQTKQDTSSESKDTSTKDKGSNTTVDPSVQAYIDAVNRQAALITDQQAASVAAAKAERQSAYDLLYQQFKQYGLESLVDPLKGLITSGASPAEFTIKLRETPAYKLRFSANAQRINKGLTALNEAEYLAKEDAYQNIMRNYGLPETYWAKDSMGTQEGFTKLIANDVSALELENRIQTANDVIEKGPTAYIDAIKQFYPEISRGDLMAYVLDPKNAVNAIQSKVNAAKIGGEYLRAGLDTNVARAESLAREGVTAERARLGAQAVLDTAPRGSQLAEFYKAGPYGQEQVEEEVYGLAKASKAKKERERLTALEQGSFSGASGMAQGALSRDRANASSGAGLY